jgi:putative transposase
VRESRREPEKAMSSHSEILHPHQRWAQFRFSVVGPLLAAPPGRGELQAQLDDLAAKSWQHPISAQWVHFGRSTIERWYYAARNETSDPVRVLQRKVRSDCGQHPALSTKLREVLIGQYRAHPSWSYQLHFDNLAALARQDPCLGPLPAYGTMRRFMQSQGLFKRRRRGPVHRPGALAAEHRFESREVRSYQSEYVHALWHLDFHHGSLRVLRPDGQWAYPLLLGVLDDRSRLACHVQWYLAEGAQELCHGLSQAFQKRALPRALMTDNGSAMLAAEIRQGLLRLGIVHELTLPYSPYQNGKQESFWGQIEGRLLPMLEGVTDLSLAQLNEATQAWLEMEYNRKIHSELGQSPLQAYLDTREVGRAAPASEVLRQIFTAEVARTQRRSDGTCTLHGLRLEVPSRYAHFQRLHLRYATWDLSQVHLSDPVSGTILCRLYPLDKERNAQGKRRSRQSIVPAQSQPGPPSGLAPLLEQIVRDYAATGLPPAYLLEG